MKCIRIRPKTYERLLRAIALLQATWKRRVTNDECLNILLDYFNGEKPFQEKR